jgi:glycosyltransferase involved in cell wall biosynthesis
MKIAWLANYPYLRLEPHLEMRRPIGGHPSSWVASLAVALSQRADMELHIVTLCPHITVRKAFVAEGVMFHVLPSGVPFSDRGFPWYLPLDAASGFRGDRRHLVREIRSIGPDLVHAFGTEGPYTLAALDSGLRHLIHIQGIIGECMKAESSIRFRLAEPLERRAIRQGRWFSCRTDFDAGYVRSHNPRAEISHIHEAVSRVFFDVHWTVRDSSDLLFVGALKERKGIEDVLMAIHLLRMESRPVHLRVVGCGTVKYRISLMNRCSQWEISDCVEFLGHKSSDEIARLHEQSQVFVLPSHVENSPNSVAEAMVSGVPVIASRVGGIPSMVRHLETGMLVEPKNPGALAGAIDILLSNPAKRERLSANARAVARERHDAASIARDTVDAYLRIIASRESRACRVAAQHAT